MRIEEDILEDGSEVASAGSMTRRLDSFTECLCFDTKSHGDRKKLVTKEKQNNLVLLSFAIM